MAKHVSAYRGAGLKPNRVTKKPKQDWVSAYKRDDEKNRGGLIGGLGYVGGNLGLGIAGIGEGVGDIVSAGADILRGDTEMAKYRFLDNRTAEAQQSLRNWYNPGSVMEFAGDVASGIGQSSVFLLDAVAPGVGTGLFFAGVGGQGISSAAARTGDVGWREVGYGVASGAAEGALELALGAGSKVAGKLGASITRKAGTAIGQKGITTALTKSAGKRAWSSIAKATAKDAAGEFAEEFASEYIDTALLHAFGIDPNASTSFGEAVRAGMVGLFSGGIMSAPGNVINYKNAAKAGRTIRESGETENLLNRAQATVSVLREQEAVKRAEGKKVKKTDEGTEAAEKKGFLARQGAKREARRAAEYAAKLEKNVNAYRNMKAEMRNSEVGDALLGELRGNLYFTNMAYAVEEAEIVLRNVDDAQAQKIVDYINTEAKKAKQEKSDYTVEDFRLNRDGILSQFAARGRTEQLINGEWTEAEEMAAQAAEATESPVEAAETAGAVTGEEVDTPEQAAPAEESEGVQAETAKAEEAPADHKARAEQLLRGMGETVGVQKLAEAIDKRMRGEALSVYERSELNENIKAQKVIEQLQRESQQKKAPEKAEAKPEAQKQTKGTVTVSDGMKPNKDFSDVQYATYKAAGILSDSLGLNIEIHKSLERNDKIVNGYYDTGTKVLHVNINAMRDGRQIALYTLGHELTHYIKDWSPEKFNALADFVAEQMGTDMETAVDEKMASLRRLGLLDKKTTEQAAEMAREEVVADGMELILTDGRVLDELAKTDKSLWEKVRDWIKNTVAKIRKYYGELNQASKTAQVLKETMDSLDELERLFTEGVREAGEVAVSEGERRYSIDETTEAADVSGNAADANVSGNEEEITDRDMLLAMAEQLVGNAEENKILSDYKAQYDTQKERQKKLDSIYDEIGEQKSILYTSPDATQRSAAAKRLKELYVEMNDVSQELAGVDRELTKIEGMKAVRNLLVRERKTSKKIYQEKYERMNKARREATETTELRRQTRRIYNRLYRMLAHPTKIKNVPYEMQGITADALRAANMDLDALERLEQLEEQLSKLEREGVPDPDKIAKKEKEIKAQEKKVGSMKEQIQVLVEIFEKSKEINTGVGANVYSDDALAILKDLQTEIGNVSIRNANREQLASLKKFYDTLYTRINNANKAFATEKAASIDQMSTKANTQVKEAKSLKFLSPKPMEITGKNSIRRFFWKNMKPLTVFEAIGSDELMSIFKRVLDGEDVWITDILEAKKALDEAKKKYGYNKWNFKERREVTTADGSKVSLTLGEMMSLYAYMFREQAEEHLSAGGFVFAPDAKAIEKFKDSKVLYEAHLNDQTPHRMRKEDIAKMSEMLTQEQRAYAEAVQKYLTGLGAKGNKVSRKLYGIDLFKETAYFPIKSSHDYIETSTGKSGDPNIKSRGTFKETVPKAGNPIVLEDFMEVVGNHVNTMATYHAFVLPVEDLTRVWNYTPVNIKRDADGKAILDENGMPVADTEGAVGYNSLKAEITKKYGKEANDYILQLLRDLNGGARRESAASILDKGLTAFKRSATMLSLSTIVQQPTSIIRAMAYVDAKHFTGASFVPWETVKKYAPVAAIKEVGGHDTNTGARTVDYINAKEYDSIKDAAKAAVTPEIYGGDPNVRAEAFGWLTGKADEVSWRYMFGAIVNEQAEKLGKPKESEEVMKAASERFAEVVRRTQVYDSTLTRSEFMRSKDGLMKMATAFGAEPTTVVSMVADAIIKAERGDKTFLRKSAAGIAFSVIANAAVVSLIYAMRDDDEDETIPEKYVQSLTSELIEGFNFFEYLPVARDVVSLFKGYEIERSDMALVGNLMDQVELITSSKRSVPDKIFGVTGAVSAFFGLPVTNVYRDFKGLVKTGQSFTNAEKQTGAGFGFAMGDAVSGQFNLFAKLFGAESGNDYELYTAYVDGDTAHYNRVAARYEDEKAAEQALRKELRENDGRIGEAAKARMNGETELYESIVRAIVSEGIFDRNMVIRAVNNEISALERELEKGILVPEDPEAEDTPEALYKASDLNAAMERGDREDYELIYDTILGERMEQGKTEAQAKAALKSSITAYWKKQYLSGYQDTETRKRIIKLLTDTGLYGSRNDVATMCEGWVRAKK